MAHGIVSNVDRGIVYGVSHVWHGLKEYTCRPDQKITIDEVRDIANYELEKTQLWRTIPGEDGIPNYEKVDGAHCIVRKDTGNAIVPTVGRQFTALNNVVLVDAIKRGVLDYYPELEISSVGTLFGGATFFLDLQIEKFQITGDKSPTVTRLMYANPLGRGSYKVCLHDERIVCANTQAYAEQQGRLNETLAKFPHTASAVHKINNKLLDLSEVATGIKAHRAKMDYLAGEPLSTKEVDQLLEQLFPSVGLDVEKDKRRITIAKNSKEGVLQIFEGREHRETLANPFTKYGFYQAFTDWIDHQATARNMDDASIWYDGITGGRAKKKETVLDMLTAA